MKRFSDQRGQTTVVIALSIFTLCGMAGLSADVGTLFRAKRVLQTAADAGAIAAAAEAYWNNSSAAAKAIAASNGVTDGTNGYTVTESIIPSGYQVVATQAAPTYFMKLFHLTSVTVSATAVANNGPGNGCIFTLDTSGVDVGLSGTGTLTMPDCGVVVNSAGSKALSLTGGSAINALSIGIVGGYSDSSNAPNSLSPTPVTGIAPAANPLSFEPAPSFSSSSCLPDPHPTGGPVTLGPAVAGGTVCYNGLSISGSGAVTFNPGTYIINGAFSMSGSGTASGAGVTFYMAPPNGSLSLTGSGALTLSAPTSGTYDGILFFQDPSDTNTMKVAGASGSDIEGIFYAPSAALNLSGSSGATFYADLVTYALGISGNNSIQSYAKKNANTPLTAPRLVQ